MPERATEVHMKVQTRQTREQKAVIYCRVSGKKQKAEGSGLDSQEHRCRQYAEAKGYSVEAVFYYVQDPFSICYFLLCLYAELQLPCHRKLWTVCRGGGQCCV